MRFDPTLALGLAVGVPLLYIAYRTVNAASDAAGAIKDAAVDAARVPSDVVDAGVAKVTGDKAQTLGGLIFDFTHPEFDAPTSSPSALDRLRRFVFGGGDTIIEGYAPAVVPKPVPQAGSLTGIGDFSR